SGAGFFELASADAQKTQEFQDGIAKLYQHSSEHEALNDYIALIKSFNEKGELAFYPGSPKIAEHYLRRQDKGWFFELHPRD
ncbi:23S rRNA (adenine(2030)-N(6))-methyltransferase RlmJ, partial [Streptomyces europaeiscabiei]|uniref:23S rRNA (adenine(2030)-N(6))-methyltransferase RlmJ n=1 Tax=Streptomyces europaeiscabiei TaxID=146819 RepID=UPI0038F6597A